MDSSCHTDKLAPLAKRIQSRFTSHDHFCSFEVSPPKSERNYDQLLKSIKTLQDASRALFIGISWHLETATLPDESPTLNFAAAMEERSSVLLHLSAAGLNKSQIPSVLKKARSLGIKNIFALRGDRSHTSKSEYDIPYAADLVYLIRKTVDNSLSICVAGYPDGHPHSNSLQEDLTYLKKKVDAGADFVITQFCFQAEVIINFVKECRRSGITVPIIPGVFPIQDYESLHRMASLCHVEVPDEVHATLQSLHDHPKAIQEYGIHLAVDTVSKIFASGVTYGVHLFTLNREPAIVEVCRRLGFNVPSPKKPLYCADDKLLLQKPKTLESFKKDT